MSIDIDGWIEVKNPDSEEWLGEKRLLDYMIVADANSDYMFGITKVSTLNPIASNRGLPEDVSAQVKIDLESYGEFGKDENNFSFDELFGFSFITYSEIIALEVPNNIEDTSQWVSVFETMKLLQNAGNEAENIRIIVWAIW